MADELRTIEAALNALLRRPPLRAVAGRGGQLSLASLELADVAKLLDDPAGALFLMAAARLNRTQLRAGVNGPDAQLVPQPLRRAYVVRTQLPATADFDTVVELALAQRAATLGRSTSAQTEVLFKQRLEFEGLPIRMGAGAYTSGLLIERRKPDGVYPDPATGRPPRLYLEVKKSNRPRDDIQKRLYEIVEVGLEMKLLYGDLQLQGFAWPELLGAADRPELHERMRARITRTPPVVVALILSSYEDIEYLRRYRPAAEAFIDRVFFADEIDECLALLSEVVALDLG